MARPRKIFVQYDKKDKSKPWEVQQAGNSRASSRHRKKSAAVRRGKAIAKRAATSRKPVELVIKTRRGTISTKHSYGGRDPRHIKG